MPECLSRMRCASLEVLPAESPMPQKGCYRTTPSARGGIVTRRSQEEYTAVVRARYAEADRVTKGRILDEYCRTASCHRKAAIRALRRPPPRRPHRRGRLRQYDLAVAPARERLWEVSDTICRKLLRAALPTLLPALQRHGGLRPPPHHRRPPPPLDPRP